MPFFCPHLPFHTAFTQLWSGALALWDTKGTPGKTTARSTSRTAAITASSSGTRTKGFAVSGARQRRASPTAVRQRRGCATRTASRWPVVSCWWRTAATTPSQDRPPNRRHDDPLARLAGGAGRGAAQGSRLYAPPRTSPMPARACSSRPQTATRYGGCLRGHGTDTVCRKRLRVAPRRGPCAGATGAAHGAGGTGRAAARRRCGVERRQVAARHAAQAWRHPHRHRPLPLRQPPGPVRTKSPAAPARHRRARWRHLYRRHLHRQVVRLDQGRRVTSVALRGLREAQGAERPKGAAGRSPHRRHRPSPYRAPFARHTKPATG